jgi:glycosyltransferase involved in cell wall biosynthesis
MPATPAGAGARPLTVLVEPDPGGHRFQWVSHVVRGLAEEGSDVLLLTSTGATATDAYATFLAPLDVTAVERFDGIYPPAAEIGQALVEVHRERPLRRWVVMDSDQMVKRWWLHAPRELRSRRTAPYGVLVMTRFPPRILPDRHLLWLRSTKSLLTLLAMARGSARRMAYVAGRDQLRQGLLFKRLRDPALCSAHARDRAALRAASGLPLDRRIVGILGMIDVRKNVPLVGDAVEAAGPDVDLLVAGGLSDDVVEWIESLPPERRARVHVRSGFLTDAELDGLTAACDVVAVVQQNPGPSGIMGKAQAAGVPVLSSGSQVRRRETAALGSGVHTETTVEAIAAGLRTLLARGTEPVPVPPGLPTAAEFADVVLRGGAPSLRLADASRRSRAGRSSVEGSRSVG